MAEEVRVEVDCTAGAVDSLGELIAEANPANQPPRFVKRQNLDGEAATWIVLTTLATQALPHLLDFVSKQLDRRTVRRFKVGEIEIENPTERDLELLRRQLTADGSLPGEEEQNPEPHDA